ncbi:separin [Astyanax mexicanus]|uniref:separin n=1 Tax=Astyanax mexicanus TaxID=7994 RepID=UPI0020CB40DE|nr:separin [Astyanax mexicanus]
MKCLKTDEYVQRISSIKDTVLLHDELKKHVNEDLGPWGRTVCDRIIRACNQRLGSGPLQPDHQGRLVDLVELAVKGYGLNADPAVSGCPLYLEKIIFHILQKLVSQGAHGPASRLGELMYHRLQTYSTEAEALSVLVRNCFAVLWNGLLTPGSRAPSIPPRDRLRWQLQALLFRLMEGTSNTSKVPLFVEEVVGEFERACGGLSQDDAAFLLSELQMRFLSPPLGENAGGDCVQMLPFLAVRCQVIFKVCKLLCKGKFWTEASGLVDSAVAMVRRLCDILCPSLGLAAHAVQLQCALTSGDECSKAFTDCARILRGLPATMRDIEAHTLLEACQLVVWAIEAGQTKGMDRTTLLACFSFLEEYQEILLKQQKTSFSQQLQYSLCFCLYQGFISTYDSLHSSQESVIESLDRVLLYCQATAGRMMTELRRLSNDNFLLKAVCAVNNVVYELFNRKLYEEAFGLAEIMCQELRKDCPASLPVERVNRCFMLVVQCSRRVSQMEKALDWVVSWIQVLGARVLDHIAEPVSLWVKTKCDAARAGEEDTRLRTLRDGLGATLIDEEVLLRLLEEELRLYKDQTGDTAQERYNTLCDLLDICHEDTTHTLRRASYLCEMAQVVCYQDFSQQTDCSAVDFTHEALRLLDEEQETAENADRLNDEKAYASLWLYICTLEANLQEALDTEKRLREVQEGITTGNLDPVPTNDLEYEDKQKTQDSQLVYDGLRFNLVAHNKRSKPLDRCLSLWRSLLKEGKVPAVRDPTNTAYSISLMASLYTLMGKPLQALEGYQLSAALFRLLGDGQNSAGAFCQSARLLLDLGSPQLSQVQLEQAEQCLAAESGSEAVTVISVTITLLRAQLYYALGEVKRGVCSLSEVLKQTAQHHSKSWYMLKARALQVASAYLSLDTSKLQTLIRQTIIQRGVKTPDTAQYEGLKLLCSLVMSLLGNGFYGAPAPNVDTRFVDRGDSVVFKWLLLGEVLLCSERMVQIRSSSGAAHEAKAQCLEALKLATKLHTLSHCAELLVLKAELELMKGSSEASTLDLEQVRHLLDDGTDFGQSQQKKSEVKIKPRKGRPAVATPAPQTSAEDEDIDGLLSSRSLGREPVDGLSDLGQDASPTLKPKRQRALSCLTHGESCSCSCCSEPTLVRVSVLWALVQADLQKELQYSCRLRHFAKLRCSSITAKIQSRLKTLISSNFSPRQSLVPSMLQAEVARLHLGTVLTQLHCGAGEKEKAASLWEEIEAGLQAVEDKGALCPELGPLRAALLGAKAVVCCLALAGKKQCSPDDLFSAVWGWNPSLTAVALKIKTQLKQQNRLKSSGDGDQLNPAAKTSAKTLPASQRNTYLEQGSNKTEISAAMSKKAKDPVSKISIARPSMVFKTPRAMRTPSAKSAAGKTGDMSAFDFTTEVPDITVSSTPLTTTKATAASRSGVTKSKTAPKGSFQVFEDSSPQQEKPVTVPAAPKRTKRSRFKVEFSDESDAETAPPPVEVKSEKKRSVSSASKTPSAPKPATKVSLNPAAVKDAPRKPRAVKKSTALCASGPSSEEELGAPSQSLPRRGRSRKAQNSNGVEPPERMRMIKEDEDEEGLDISLENLQESDSETQNTGSPADGQDTDFEVLRRDLGADLNRDCVNELRSIGQNGVGGHASLPHTHVAPAELSLEVVRSLLCSAWVLLHHFPSPSLYPHLCSLLAQLLGLSDPLTTAMLHAQSMGVSTRHHMTRYLANRLRKLKKSSGDIVENLSALSLEESSLQSQMKTLSALESIYSFSLTQSAHFPNTHCQEFTQQLKDLPAGVTVCLLSLVAVSPGEIGSTILLTRLEHDCDPITIRIPTAHRPRSMPVLLEEMEGVLQGQKEVSNVADKVQWWDCRKALDARVQRLLEEMEEALGIWRALLLPLTSDPKLQVQLETLQASIEGAKITSGMLKVVLSAAPLLSQSDLHSLAEGAGLMEGNFLKLLQKGVSELKGREEPQGHTVLILDKYLQRLPWENISCLRPRSVSRMPSLQAVLGHGHLQKMNSDCVLSRGVDPQQVYFVLNPDGNLPETEKRFRDWFTSEKTWQGVCGVSPDPDKLQEAITTKDLYIYVGHGAGARFLDAQRVMKGPVQAAALLFGCSSAALSVQGCLEGTGIILSYLIAGCPLVLGNLWDVTDRDIDRFTSALLQSWLSGGSGSSLLQHLSTSRDATHLKHMIGAAPIAYGLPVHLQ